MRKITFVLLIIFAAACSKNDPDNDLDANPNPNEEPNEQPKNTAPVIPVQTFTANEHAAAGTAIGVVETTDIDGDDLIFSITSEWDIVIDASSGELTVGPTLKLDYESDQNVTFTISVSDGKNHMEKDFSLVINDVDEIALLTDDQKDLIAYFEFLALWKGPSNTRVTAIQKWTIPMNMHISGTVSQEFNSIIGDVIGQFNSYMTLGEFNIAITEDVTEANAQVFVGTKAEVEGIWPDIYAIIENATYHGYASTPSEEGKLTSTRIWISLESELLFQHELGHVLGLGHSQRCGLNGSFLCSDITLDKVILPIEQDIIKYLYSSNLPAGLPEAKIEAALANMILNN